MNELLSALSELNETTLIFTLPNADTGGLVIISEIEKFVEDHSNAYSFKSLGQVDYLSCINLVDGVIGNSSSGLTEVPSFRKGTINIGDRQKGRLLATSVINVEPTKEDIKKGLSKLYSDSFRASLLRTENPYGSLGTANKIYKIVRDLELEGLLKKTFFQVNRIEA